MIAVIIDNANVDIWSLGITLIELADGQVPYHGQKAASAMFLLTFREPPALTEPGNWSTDMTAFILRCLVKDPDKRAESSQLLTHPWIRREVDMLQKCQAANLPCSLPSLVQLCRKNWDSIVSRRKPITEADLIPYPNLTAPHPPEVSPFNSVSYLTARGHKGPDLLKSHPSTDSLVDTQYSGSERVLSPAVPIPHISSRRESTGSATVSPRVTAEQVRSRYSDSFTPKTDHSEHKAHSRGPSALMKPSIGTSSSTLPNASFSPTSSVGSSVAGSPLRPSALALRSTPRDGMSNGSISNSHGVLKGLLQDSAWDRRSSSSSTSPVQRGSADKHRSLIPIRTLADPTTSVTPHTLARLNHARSSIPSSDHNINNKSENGHNYDPHKLQSITPTDLHSDLTTTAVEKEAEEVVAITVPGKLCAVVDKLLASPFSDCTTAPIGRLTPLSSTSPRSNYTTPPPSSSSKIQQQQYETPARNPNNSDSTPRPKSSPRSDVDSKYAVFKMPSPRDNNASGKINLLDTLATTTTKPPVDCDSGASTPRQRPSSESLSPPTSSSRPKLDTEDSMRYLLPVNLVELSSHRSRANSIALEVEEGAGGAQPGGISGNGGSVMSSARLHLLSDKLNPFVAPLNVATTSDVDAAEDEVEGEVMNNDKSISKVSLLPQPPSADTTNHSSISTMIVGKTSADGLLESGGASDVSSLVHLRSDPSTPAPVNASSAPMPEHAEGGLWVYLTSWCGCSQPPMTTD